MTDGTRQQTARAEAVRAPGQSTGELLCRYPVISFAVLAYGLSWLGWTPYVLSQHGLGLVQIRFPEILGDGQLAGLLPGAYIGPLLSAYLVTRAVDGPAGVRRWGRRLVRWRAGWPWYVFALLGIPLLLAVGTLPLPGAAASLTWPSLSAVLVYFPMLVIQMLTTGIAEEPGWRDFALPRIQRSHGPVLGGTVILGIVWSGWHLPLFLTDWAAAYPSDALTLVLFTLVGIVLSLLITWVFNHTNEGLPLAMLIHASNNNFLSVVWPALFPDLEPSRNILWASLIGYGALSLVLLTVTRGRLGYPRIAERPDQGTHGRTVQM